MLKLPNFCCKCGCEAEEIKEIKEMTSRTTEVRPLIFPLQNLEGGRKGKGEPFPFRPRSSLPSSSFPCHFRQHLKGILDKYKQRKQ